MVPARSVKVFKCHSSVKKTELSKVKLGSPYQAQPLNKQDPSRLVLPRRGLRKPGLGGEWDELLGWKQS